MVIKSTTGFVGEVEGACATSPLFVGDWAMHDSEPIEGALCFILRGESVSVTLRLEVDAAGWSHPSSPVRRFLFCPCFDALPVAFNAAAAACTFPSLFASASSKSPSSRESA